ncbi:MAG: hypothetical protein ACREHG_05765, partial [Candidatus Saccharimonadales bacterium]
MSTYGLERFSDFDSAVAVPAVPTTANAQPVVIPQLLQTDILTDVELYLQFKASGLGAYSGTLNLSPMFPYNFIGNFKFPFQSNSVAAVNMDGHLVNLITMMRSQNRKWRNPLTFGDQKFALATGYSPQAQLGSSSSYSVAPSTAETYQFRLSLPVSLWFDSFFDTDAKGNLGRIQDSYVSPLLMQSIGRSIVPQVTLNPVVASRYDRAPFVQTGTLTTAPVWTDGGSNLTMRRRGYRQPAAGAPLPPIFNWAYNWTLDQVNIGSALTSYNFPVNGQLLSCIIRMFDPTLNSGIGGMIPVANLSSALLQYGAGLSKYNDVPISFQDRMLDQHG